MNKEQLRIEINKNHAWLETARRVDDYDSAQALCGELQRLYRLMTLNEQQTQKESKEVVV